MPDPRDPQNFLTRKPLNRVQRTGEAGTGSGTLATLELSNTFSKSDDLLLYCISAKKEKKKRKATCAIYNDNISESSLTFRKSRSDLGDPENLSERW